MKRLNAFTERHPIWSMLIGWAVLIGAALVLLPQDPPGMVRASYSQGKST